MLIATSSLLVSLALTAGIGSPPPASALHHDVEAYVTGYNTTPGQTDSTPCLAASGADICGRRDAVACPRHISLGTTVEIRGATYVCEDRLAKKFDDRFDISCDKDTACPPQVTGWTTIRVYDDERREAAAAVTKIAAIAPTRSPTVLIKTTKHVAQRHAEPRPVALVSVAAQKPASPIALRLASALKTTSVLRGHG
jgi:hypothetical protein